MSKIGQAWKGDLKRGCLQQLLAALLVIPLVTVFVFYPLYYANTANISRETQTLIYMAIPIVFCTVFIGGMLLAILIARYRRKCWLDAVFGESGLGLAGSQFLLHFRQYHGHLGGRKVAIYFYRGPTIDIYVRTPLQTRLYCHEVSKAPRVFGKIQLHRVGDAFGELNNLWINALDQDWGNALLSQPKVRTLLVRLFTAPASALVRQVQIQPGAVLFKLYRNQNLYRYDLNRDMAQAWLSDLLALSAIVEALPAPSVQAQASSLEQQSQFDRDTMNKKITVITCGCFGLLFLFLAAIGGVIAYTQFYK